MLCPSRPAPVSGQQGCARLALEWLADPCAVPFFVGVQKGFFANHGISLDIITPSVMGEWVNSDIPYCLDSGKIDVAVYYMPFALQAMSQGARMKVIATLVKEPLQELTYLDGKGIEGLADLHGKALGYSFLAAERHFGRFYQYEADRQGIDLHEFAKFGYYTTRALLTGHADAIFTFHNLSHPQLSEYGFTPKGIPLSALNVPHYHELVITASAFYLRQHPDFAERFRHSLDDTLSYCKANPDEAWEIYTRLNIEKDPEEPAYTWERKAWQETAPLLAQDQQPEPGCWERFYQWMREHDLVVSRLCLDDFLECPR